MKLLLIDDHQLLLDGLVLLIEECFEDAELICAGSLVEAKRALELNPDTRLVLLDLGLPDASGLASLFALRRLNDAVTVVVLSGDQSSLTVTSAIEAGAAGYIVKSAASDEMMAALRHVLSGGIYVPAGIAQEALPVSANAIRSLSSRQREVLQLLVLGRPNKLICRELCLSESTVKTHVTAIFNRLGVHSRTQAVVAAARMGWKITP
ncbi:MAG: hypothetical protein AD742_09670 [Methylibium sp. NZG]|nr:MAG: hypothetical protein AD742_09670 [Methylibium sp. NZG]